MDKPDLDPPDLLRILSKILLHRDHSEFELRAKLARHLSPTQTNEAVAIARAKGWLPTDEDVARRLVESLHQKRKGALYIAHQLRLRGLPSVDADTDLELIKGRELIESKLANGTDFDYESKLKLHRFLIGRGFDPEVVGALIDLGQA